MTISQGLFSLEHIPARSGGGADTSNAPTAFDSSIGVYDSRALFCLLRGRRLLPPRHSSRNPMMITRQRALGRGRFTRSPITACGDRLECGCRALFLASWVW